MPEHFAGLDLGQASDYSALAIVECFEQPTGAREPAYGPVVIHQDGTTSRPERDVLEWHYQVRHLQRYPLGTSYPTIVTDVATLLGRAELGERPALIVDYTGVGRPVVDLFKLAKLPGTLTPVLIHGGDQAIRDGQRWHVPKRDLVSVVQVLLQSGRLKIAPALAEAATLTAELQAFQVKLSAAGHDSYGAWREGAHDDLVLAVALACWASEKGRPGRWRVLG